MLVVKGKCDGKVVRLEREVPVKGEVDVLVEFPEMPADEPPMTDEEFKRFLRNGPVFSEEEIASIEEGRKGSRRPEPGIP